MNRNPERSGLSTRSVEIAVALLTLALGGLVTYASYQLGSSWGADGPQAGYFPFYVGLLICIGSLVNLGEALFKRLPEERALFADWSALGRVLAVTVPAALYVAGIYLVGIYVSSALYIAGFMIWIGGYSWTRSLAVGFGVSFALFAMFELWFQVLLPKGAFNVLSVFGY
jgi:hypothetical protein